MSKKELFKRYALFIVSLFFSALGVALTKHAELGVSPISSVANVMSERFTFLSLGNWLIIWNCLLILGQVLLLRRDFKLVQLLQLPLSFVFGWFTDLGLIIVRGIPVGNYFVRLLLVASGTLVLAFGIALSVIANVVMNSGEAFVKAIADRSGRSFGGLKIAFDVTCVIAAVALSLVLFKGKIIGTREGTVITALLTGAAVKLFTKPLASPVEKILVK